MNSVYEATLSWLNKQKLAFWAAPEVSSTNEIAKIEAFQIKEDAKIYLTDTQTEGRGRGGHRWLNSGSGHALLATWSFHLAKSPQAITPALVGLAFHEAVHETWPELQLSLKAPNDLLIAGQKTAGILIESVHQGSKVRILVGIGLNISDHPRDVPEATHLAAALGRTIEADEWAILLSRWHDKLKSALQKSLKPDISSEDRNKLKAALNRNPHLTEPLQDISPKGDLIFATHTKPWLEV